jgi:hypothetical protein
MPYRDFSGRAISEARAKAARIDIWSSENSDASGLGESICHV